VLVTRTLWFRLIGKFVARQWPALAIQIWVFFIHKNRASLIIGCRNIPRVHRDLSDPPNQPFHAKRHLRHMSNENIETNAPANGEPPQPQPVWELPSLDRIRTQAIMAAIVFVGQSPSYDPRSLRHETEVKTAVDIAADLLDRIEQQERHYTENRLIDESGHPETVEPQR
jgi:hypothetical protein